METSAETQQPSDKAVEKIIQFNRELFGFDVQIIDTTLGHEAPEPTSAKTE